MNIKKQIRLEFDSLVARNLAYWTEKTGSKKAALWRLRNAAIESVCRTYDNSRPITLYHGNPVIDRVRCEDRARHYGVPIGSVVNTYHKRRADYNCRMANFMRLARSTALTMELVK